MANSTVLGVLPAGSIPPSVTLEAGVNRIIIADITTGDDYVHYFVTFPDGYTKKIQAENAEGLLSRISSNLRARYGVEIVDYTSVPSQLEQGSVIEFNI